MTEQLREKNIPRTFPTTQETLYRLNGTMMNIVAELKEMNKHFEKMSELGTKIIK